MWPAETCCHVSWTRHWRQPPSRNPLTWTHHCQRERTSSFLSPVVVHIICHGNSPTSSPLLSTFLHPGMRTTPFPMKWSAEGQFQPAELSAPAPLQPHPEPPESSRAVEDIPPGQSAQDESSDCAKWLQVRSFDLPHYEGQGEDMGFCFCTILFSFFLCFNIFSIIFIILRLFWRHFEEMSYCL